MVDAASNTGWRAKDWGFEEEPPAAPMRTGTTGKAPALGWDGDARTIARASGRSGFSFPPVLDVAALKSAPPRSAVSSEVTGSDRSFADTTSLGAEILRLKGALALPGHDEATGAAIRQQIVMRQSEWVTKAKAEGLREPAGALDPLRASTSEVESALAWSEAGGVVPRRELARDGGRAFRASVRDAAVLQTKGFDALLALHDGDPDEQRSLLARELGNRGVRLPSGEASLDSLRALYRASVGKEDAERPTIGLDGHVGTAEQVDAYERDQAVLAMNPGTTLGSLLATSSVALTGTVDVPRMRTLGETGGALEGVAGGAGGHVNRVAAEREPMDVPKPDLDNFNRTGLEPRFKATELDPFFKGEELPGNDVWNVGRPTKPHAVKYIDRFSDREPYRIEARPVKIGDKTEVRLVDANGELFDTREATAHDGAACAIFVMNQQGEFFSSTFQEVAYLHHSSLSGGEQVAAAGELVVENGKLLEITNRSGHFLPGAKLTEQALRSLREQGLDLAGVKVVTQPPFGAPTVQVLR